MAHFCWLIQPSTDAGSGMLQELAIPRQVSWLVFDGDDARLETRGSGIRFETIAGGRNALLMETPPGVCARVDGRPAPRLALLGLKSEVQLEAAVLYLTRFHDCELGPPPRELIGLPCPVCTVELTPDSTVLVHDCGRGLHQDPDTVPEAERLECALLSDRCAHCEETIVREPGFAWRPF